MSIVVAGLSHHSSPVTVRECFAFKDSEISEVLKVLKTDARAREAVILSTCNRVEVYADLPEEGEAAAAKILREFLIQNRGYEGPLGDEIYFLDEPKSVEHLFRVASGLDSMVLGETEILGQLKKAYQMALEEGATGKRLNKAFQKAFNVAKYIRTETQIQRGSTSVGSVGVELAEKIFSSLEDRRVMVIGAGDTSEKTARSLLSRGAHSIMVSNRSYDKAVKLAAELEGEAVHFDEWPSVFHKVDIVISSTSAPHYVLDRAKLEPMMKERRRRKLLLIDLAVPRDIDPEINLMEEVYVYNIDDLQALAEDSLRQRREEIDRCEAIIRERASALLSPPSSANGREDSDLGVAVPATS